MRGPWSVESRPELGVSEGPGIIPCPSPHKPLGTLATTTSPLPWISCLFVPHPQIPTQTSLNAVSSSSSEQQHRTAPHAVGLEARAQPLTSPASDNGDLGRTVHSTRSLSRRQADPLKVFPEVPPPSGSHCILLVPLPQPCRADSQTADHSPRIQPEGTRPKRLSRLRAKTGQPLGLTPLPRLAPGPEPQILRPSSSQSRPTPAPQVGTPCPSSHPKTDPQRLGVASQVAPGPAAAGPDLAVAGGRPTRCRPRSR